MENESIIRLTAFFSILLIMALWELISPRRVLKHSKRRRWFANLSIVVIDTVVIRLLFPVLAIGVAIWARQNNWGLFNWLGLPIWLEIILAIVLLDLVVYWQHRLFHALPLLWRMHRVHHADPEYDVSTALRFHPLEIVISMLIKLLATVLLGPAILAVLIFEVVLNASAMFNHGNVNIPASIDRWLRLVLVTPDMHRVHHSRQYDEHNSNYGFNLPWWDRLFGSYKGQPDVGHLDMEIGLSAYKESNCSRLTWMLVLPFQSLRHEE